MIKTGEIVFREQPFPGGILTRVAQSLIRIGNFEYFASKNDTKNLQILLQYLVGRSYPDLIRSDDLPLDFFKSLVRRQAHLVAQWMSLGFIHGVMNTDNTSAVGITIDYGPCAFLDETDFNKVFSSIDQQGRYSYENQPKILQWNLARLAESLLLLYDANSKKRALHAFEEELESFTEIYENKWKKLMCEKLGLTNTNDPTHISLLSKWISYLNSNKIDFTLGFRNLTLLLEPDSTTSFYKMDNDLVDFSAKWKPKVISAFGGSEAATRYLNSKNPLFIPRNHMVEEIINDTYRNDLTKLNEFMLAIRTPFENQENFKQYATPANEDEKVRQTFCGT